MIYAIGTPGEKVRIYIETGREPDALSQLTAGEVCIPVPAMIGDASICGDHVEVIDADDL